MERINIYEIDNHGRHFCGWFDAKKATTLAQYREGDTYVSGTILLVTANGRLVINEWSNTGTDVYRFVKDEREIAETLSKGGYNGEEEYLLEILNKYEI